MSEEETNAETTTEEPALSALQDNIAKKGKNAYYFAHSHKASGPTWDGKKQPKLLSKESSDLARSVRSSFDVHASNITSYAFADEPLKVKLYVEMEGVGDKCSAEDDVTLDFTETSFSLVVRNYKEEEQRLCFAKLTDKITNASFKLKTNRIILTLTKAEEKEWHTINDKGTPDYEVV